MTLKESLNYQPSEISFGTSGLRALASEMTDLECYINAKGFLAFLADEEKLAPDEIIYIAGDLRESTPRVLRAVTQAVQDSGYRANYCGLIPTPNLAYYAEKKNAACIMVTGSHIPADRNGIKFYKQSGEVLKSDEVSIKEHVQKARDDIYSQSAEVSKFDERGNLRTPPELPELNSEAEAQYRQRYLNFPGKPLEGKHIVLYQHSAVGRDLIADVLEQLGAKVSREGRSDIFIPIDTENVTPDNKKYFRELAVKYPDNFAIISTDGDSDRPFVIDETGEFHRGDIVGCIVAKAVGADFAAAPISCNDAVDEYLDKQNILLVHTKIGSPYVIDSMNGAVGYKSVVGWEVNGGFLLNSEVELFGNKLDVLPTRDALLPILVVLLVASKEAQKVSETFAALPARYTGGALLDDVNDVTIGKLRSMAEYQEQIEQLVRSELRSDELGEVVSIDFTDGVRVHFASNDVIHIRPSGNAPQLRIYTNCDTQVKADEFADKAVEQGGLLEKFVLSIAEK